MQDVDQLIEELEQLSKRQEELSYIAISNASDSLRRLGIICLLIVVIEFLLCFIVSKYSAVTIVSMLICGGTAIINFYRSKQLAKQAQKYKK